MKSITTFEWKPRAFGVYSLVFGLLGVFFLFFFTLWLATPLLTAFSMIIALSTGVMGLVKGGFDNDTKTVFLSYIGIALSVLPGFVALLSLL